MAITLFRNLSEKDKDHAIQQVIEQSTPSHDFFMMVILSVLMATLGLLLDNTAVVIGSMLIAPILSPILGISMGVVMADAKLIGRSLLTLVKAVGLSVPSAFFATLIFSSQVQDVITAEVVERANVSILFAAVGFVAGAAASFAVIKPQLSVHFPGVAISVALIPPLAVSGVGLARFDLRLASSAFVLFLITASTVIFSSMVIFSLMRLYVKRSVASREIKQEDAKMAREEKRAKRESSRMKRILSGALDKVKGLFKKK